MPKPDARNLKRLIDRLTAFVAVRREGGASWAPVAPGDVSELYALFRAIVELKWSRDCDGDLPIEFEIVDRTVYQRMHYSPVRYAAPDDADYLDQLQTRACNLSIAAGDLDHYLKVFLGRRRDADGEEAAAERRDNPLNPYIADLLEALKDGMADRREIAVADGKGEVDLTTRFRRKAEDALWAAGDGPIMPHPERCPCDHRRKRLKEAPQDGEGPPPVYIECEGCGRKGPPRPTRVDAMVAWNESVRRAKKRAAKKTKGDPEP